jgi:hypothetical protein
MQGIMRSGFPTLKEKLRLSKSKHALALALLLSLTPGVARAQEKKEEPAATSEIPRNVFRDALLDKMVGQWKLTGQFEGQPMNHAVEVEWVLNHQFLRIHEKDANAAKLGDVPYEAMVFVGYEASNKRYVAHWIDVFGGGAAIMGYGQLEGSAIKFLFDYPGQPWLTTFRWLPESGSWKWLMSAKNKEGKWMETANMNLSPLKSP